MTDDRMFQKLDESFSDPVIHCRIESGPEEKPVRAVVIDVNSAFEQEAGVSREKIRNLALSDVLTQYRQIDFDVTGILQAMLNGQNLVRFEQFSERLDRWYDVTVYSRQPGFFTTLLRDITPSKNNQDKLSLLARVSEKFLDMPSESLDYQLIIETMVHLAEAKYAVLSLYEPQRDRYRTVALAGLKKDLKKAFALLGFDPIGKRWGYPRKRSSVLQDKLTTRFPTLMTITQGTLPRPLAYLLQNTFRTGETLLVKLIHKGMILGNVTLIMPAGKVCNSLPLVELFSQQIGLLITRKKKEEELEKEFLLRTSLLDNIPDCAALILKKGSREIVASNQTAREMGAVPGKTCYKTLAGRTEACPFCLAPDLWTTGQSQQIEVEHQGTWYRDIWSSISEDFYVHYIFDFTERKTIEVALQKSEYEKSLILDATQELFTYFDLDLRIRWTNQAAGRAAGEAAEKLIGRFCYEVWHQRSEPCPECPIIRARETRKPAEGCITNPAGQVIHLRGYPVLDEAGEVTALIEFGQIITERLQMEEQLRNERLLYRTIIDLLPDAVYAKDRQGRKLLANPSDLEHMGLGSEQEALGKTDREIFPLEIALPFERDDRQVMETGEPVFDRLEKAYKKDGEERWVLTSKVPLRNDRGDLIGLVGIGRDITEEKKSKEALRQSEEKFQRIVHNIEDIVYRVDLTTKEFLYLSPAFEKVLGYTPDDVKRMGGRVSFLSQIMQGNAFTLQNRRVDDLLAHISNKQNRYEAWWRCKDGTLKCLEDVWIPVYENDRLISTDGVLRDITFRKKTEQRIRYLSFHDALTGLYNRAYLEEEMERIDTDRQLPIGIIMADVNGLKLVNDTYGHLTGDELLKAAAQVLTSVCRKEDLIARWGGDEFVVLLPRIQKAETEAIVQRIFETCRQTDISPVPLSMSLGTAGKEDPSEDLLTVFRRAEDRMYRNKLSESRSARSAVLSALRETLREKSYETGEHAQRAVELAQQMGKAIHLSSSDLDRLILLVTLHDIGKIVLPDEILRKPGPLTPDEWTLVKKHPETGYRIARSTDELAHVAEEILSHHEHWNGKGYPQGLSGEAIPLLARVGTIVDSYDAMISSRPYRKAMNEQSAIDELKRCAGQQFDPKLVAVFIKQVLQGKEVKE